MTAGRLEVGVTANFDHNLESIREFLVAAGAPLAFDALIERLGRHLIPILERFPDLGADFMGRAPLSVEGRALFERVAVLGGPEGSVRQVVDGDYVILYLHRAASVYLLAIRHQRQLSFDFAGHWP
jgi:hypothetical protein